MVNRSLNLLRTDDELFSAAEAQLRSLQISAKAFDEGLVSEAARLANSVFILVGRGMRTHTSILDSAKQQDRRQYRSTIPSEGSTGTPLIFCRLTKVAEDHWEIGLNHRGRDALLKGRDLPFDAWWEERVINTEEVRLTRSEVVRLLRDKSGGAHFDADLKDALVARSIRGGIGAFNFENSASGSVEPVPHGLEYCMRQIATELWFSLEQQGPGE